MGKLIAVEGLDGSGKYTQSKRLCELLTEKGYEVKLISYPRYGTKGAHFVEMYLGGELGNDPSDTGAYAATAFFAMDRYYSFRTELKEFYEKENSIIITDRYTTANAVHQISKLPQEQWDEFLDWLYDFEFTKLGLPCPDKVIFLEMTPEISARLVEHRANAKDIHENAHDYMAHCYKAGMYAANKLGWDIIKCYENGEPLTIEAIGEMVEEKANMLLK